MFVKLNLTEIFLSAIIKWTPCLCWNSRQYFFKYDWTVIFQSVLASCNVMHGMNATTKKLKIILALISLSNILTLFTFYYFSSTLFNFIIRHFIDSSDLSRFRKVTIIFSASQFLFVQIWMPLKQKCNLLLNFFTFSQCLLPPMWASVLAKVLLWTA